MGKKGKVGICLTNKNDKVRSCLQWLCKLTVLVGKKHMNNLICNIISPHSVLPFSNENLPDDINSYE